MLIFRLIVETTSIVQVYDKFPGRINRPSRQPLPKKGCCGAKLGLLRARYEQLESPPRPPSDRELRPWHD
ncbi:hypothetical protein THTE_3711 [Thermogutta terrifontis]|jgi:hypothetical protein|uniref:Uncharacterized protein n=1 Tax=Thermogutta terrifontis TaxID=1331910 RepID=A0A286RK58_9BACT|nr:hypothetical protein THTE_3711 [Thermogutta terrifontis]